MLFPDRVTELAVEVLHLEDSDLDAEFVRQRLEKSELPVKIRRAVDRASFVRELKSNSVDIILSDYEVPGFDGFDALDLARQLKPEIPFVFVSGAMGEDLAIETLKRGATDYVLKDRLTRLGSAVERALAEARERTERRKVEQRATKLLEGLADGFVVLDREFRMTYVNAAFEGMVSKRRDLLLNESLETAFPRETADALRQRLWPVLERRDAVEEEFEVAGWNRWFTIKATRSDNSVVVQFREVTESRRSQRELRTAEERFSFVRKSSGVGFWYCDLPFDVLEWDETVKAHFHLPQDAIVTIETFYDRLHPEDREPTRQAIQASIEQHRPYAIDYRTVSPDGLSVKWIRAIGRSAYDDSGRAVRFDGITVDLTDRVEIENRARDQAQELAAINHVGRVMAAELDLARLVQSITDATTELTGAEVGAFFYNIDNESGGEYSLSCVSNVPADRFRQLPMPRATEIFAPTFRGDGVVRLDDVTQDPRFGKNSPYDGMPAGHFPVKSYLAAPVISRSGKVLGGLFFGHQEPGVFTERSERVIEGIAAQAAVAIDNAHLFEEVRKANAEKDRLLESERTARGEVEHASRMKDEFLATLSHELRTPLNAILGWAQVLQMAKDELPPEFQDGVEIIERNARAQTQIIDDLLDMNRIISGRIRLDIQRTDLASVIQAAMETVQPAARAKDLRLKAAVDPKAGPISADPNRLQQVFWNLLMNAVKFTPRGGKVQVIVERVNSHIEVCVADSGEGIDPGFLPHVFDRFKQADSSSTRRHGGLGLGLAIVKQLVELHGGAVWARSDGKGKGSTFTVALPLTAVSAEPDTVVPRRHPQGGPGPLTELCVELEGLNILVVDDEPDARALVKRLLENCDAVVTTASSAAEAIELFRTQSFHAVISDIGMPEEDGYSLIRKIRAAEQAAGRRIPAIALTAYARAEDRVTAIVSGFQHHLTKPVEPAELIAVVASVCGRTTGRAEQD